MEFVKVAHGICRP